MFWWIVAQVVISVIASVLSSKKQSSSPAAASNIEVPTVQEGTSIPILFGTRDLQNISVVCYGKIRAERVYSDEGGKK